ncbi:hypothetical protein T440DRAFT_555930 [Plenodomus tracheiphilus IPT5]|uniref:Uncharacterized protein n=1 Tax=Plenodomus tracheiphilus IPT5 TaxID=1408161 RepID=A0A6A7B1C2_9PLEO|nr:hypothetical protein T440DRAFT_555930 [Plenodomus tracheiphilus IPT5]
MSHPPSKLTELHLFHALKVDIIFPENNKALATALYGTTLSIHPTSSFDVLSYTRPSPSPFAPRNQNEDNHQSQRQLNSTALITYTGPADSPHISWELLAFVDNDDEHSVLTGAEKLLQSLREAMGGVLGQVVKSGEWRVRHMRVPDVGSFEEGQGEEVQDQCVQEWDEGGEMGKWEATLGGIIEEGAETWDIGRL